MTKSINYYIQFPLFNISLKFCTCNMCTPLFGQMKIIISSCKQTSYFKFQAYRDEYNDLLILQ